MSFGDEFFNVGRSGLTGPLDRIIRGFIDVANRDAESGTAVAGKTLYFPPGDWVILLPSPDPFILPSWLEVMIAPGARVSPAAFGFEPRMEIRGKLTAPIGPIFSLPGGGSEFGSLVNGVITFASQSIRSVHPEWWGAGAGDAETDVRALQAAIAAVTTAPSPSLSPGVQPNMVIELLGHYLLSRPIVVLDAGGDRDMDPYSLTFRGRTAPPGAPATFTASGGQPLDAMFQIRATRGHVEFRCVDFDAAGRASWCIDARPTEETDALSLPHSFYRCVFRGAVSGLVRLQRDDVQIYNGAPTANVPGLTFRDCQFSAEIPSDGAPSVDVSQLVGVRLEGPTKAMTEFRGCTFTGQTNAMIHASSHSVVLTSCRFDNKKIPPVLLLPQYELDLWELHRTGPEGGIDVYLDATDLSQIIGEHFEGKFGKLAAGVPIIRSIVEIGTVDAQDCRSTSLQFLVTPATDVTSASNSTVVGLHHNPTIDSLLQSRVPPAIMWCAGSGDSSPPQLTLVGCRFDKVNPDSAARVYAPGGGAVLPPIVDLGIFDGNPHHDSTIREGGMVTPGLIQVGRLGMIPFRDSPP